MTAFTDDAGRLRPGWAFLLSAVLSCGIFLVSGFTAASLAGDHPLRFELLFRTLLAGLLLVLFSWLLTVGNHVESHRLAAQGLPLISGSLKQAATGCMLGAFLVITAVVPIAISGSLALRFTFNRHVLPRIGLVLFVLLVGSLAEELMFRGYPFQRLVEAIGPVRAIAVFSVLFALLHWWNPGASVWGLINTVLIGIVLAIAYLGSRALWMPWGLHFAWNTTMGLVLGLPVSGIRIFNVAIHATASGPKWLTGGSYGIEASALGTLVVLLGLALILWVPLDSEAPPTESLPEDDPSPPDVSDSSN